MKKESWCIYCELEVKQWKEMNNNLENINCDIGLPWGFGSAEDLENIIIIYIQKGKKNEKEIYTKLYNPGAM